MTNTTAPASPGDRWLRLTPVRLGLIALAWVMAVLAHNAAYGLLRGYFAEGWDEPFFFLLATAVIPAYLLVSALYTLAAMIRGKRSH